MAFKSTYKRRIYFAPYAEMIVCEEEDCLLDTASGHNQDPGGGSGDNPEFAKGIGGIWDDGDYAGGSDGVTNGFDN